MGTPEFPDLGRHCYVAECQQIDFLPFTCDSCHQIWLKGVVCIGEQMVEMFEHKKLMVKCSEMFWTFRNDGVMRHMYIAVFHQFQNAIDVWQPKVFCLEHRSYIKHNCPNGDRNNVTVVICPLCAKGVHLIPDEDPNITWERHVNTDCDPSNYEKATKKKKCPVPGCKEVLTFSNTIKCRDCTVDHCLKHRFGPDHKCPGPKKPEAGFPFMGYLSRSRKEVSKPSHAPAASSPKWGSFLTAASSFRASAEASVAKLSSELSQKWQMAKDGTGPSSSSSGSRSGQVEVCPQCGAKFPSVTTLVDHVKKVHEKGGNRAAGVKKVTIDACPKCSKGFRDPVALVEHVERDHGGTSRA